MMGGCGVLCCAVCVCADVWFCEVVVCVVGVGGVWGSCVWLGVVCG